MNWKIKALAGVLLAGFIGLGYTYYRGQVKQAAMLEEFAALDARLAAYNQQTARNNLKMVKHIAYYVHRNHNQARDLGVLRYSETISARASTIADTLQVLRHQIRNVGETEASLSPMETNQLGAHLDRYVNFIRQFIPGVAPLTQTEPGVYGEALFSRYYFYKSPTAAALAALTKLETQVRRYETEATIRQAEKVGSYGGFYTIRALAVPQSNAVAPGEDYQAQLFLGVADYRFQYLEMTANGKTIPVTSEGQGLVEFQVPAYQPGQPDTVRVSWHGTIRSEHPTDTTWQIDVPYLIVKQPAP